MNEREKVLALLEVAGFCRECGQWTTAGFEYENTKGERRVAPVCKTCQPKWVERPKPFLFFDQAPLC